MKIPAPNNKNYCAVIVALKDFVSLANCDNVQAALIFSNSVIVSKEAKPGDVGIYFPVETQLSAGFLGANSLFRKPEWGNCDTSKSGFFEESGRVRAVKFRGHKSEGFWIPLAAISYTGIALEDVAIGVEFDVIGEYPVCCKYVPKRVDSGSRSGSSKQRSARVEDRIVTGQFRLHYDTENLRRNIHKIQPEDYISISDKWHGTSAVFANLLVTRDLKWYEKVLRRIGISVSDHEYGLIWSSRRVVKGIGGREKEGAAHYYDSDVWGVVAAEIKDRVPRGYTVYGEIVGFTQEGSAIQKGYHYGYPEKQHGLHVYRVTTTNPDGYVVELPWRSMIEFCAERGLDTVKQLWFGRASELIPRIDEGLADFRGGMAWQDRLLAHLEKTFVTDKMCEHNRKEVPAEGIVVRIDRLGGSDAFKLKSFKFLEFETKSLDRGEVDLETQESAAPE